MRFLNIHIPDLPAERIEALRRMTTEELQQRRAELDSAPKSRETIDDRLSEMACVCEILGERYIARDKARMVANALKQSPCIQSITKV